MDWKSLKASVSLGKMESLTAKFITREKMVTHYADTSFLLSLYLSDNHYCRPLPEAFSKTIRSSCRAWIATRGHQGVCRFGETDLHPRRRKGHSGHSWQSVQRGRHQHGENSRSEGDHPRIRTTLPSRLGLPVGVFTPTFYIHSSVHTLWILRVAEATEKSTIASGRNSPQATISPTRPAPTVLPPSRIAKRMVFSMAIGVINSTSTFTLSPGITISTPCGSLTTPVTSVVRK